MYRVPADDGQESTQSKLAVEPWASSLMMSSPIFPQNLSRFTPPKDLKVHSEPPVTRAWKFQDLKFTVKLQ